MEHDYATRICKLPAKKIVLETVEQPAGLESQSLRRPGYLTVFTEAYQSAGFREEEVYRELIPYCLAAGRQMGLELAVKLHPFDCRRKIVRRFRNVMSKPDRNCLQIWSGVMSDESWASTRIAVTGQSSVALECKRRGIPVFLCGWLRDPFSGYQQQLARYGFGTVLPELEDIATIPELSRQSGGFSAKCYTPVLSSGKTEPSRMGLSV
jgi:hypothetical protein